MPYSNIPHAKLAEIKQKIAASPLCLDDGAAITLIKATELLDAEYYLVNNPDVKASGMDPCAHFQLYGWREGRKPNIWFNTELYKAENPDIDCGLNPLLHYVFIGHSQGRRPNANAPKTRGRIVLSLAPAAADYAAVKYSLQSLLNQTLQADKIIVQLGREHYQGKQFCYNFVNLLDQGVDLRWCADHGGYNQLLPTVRDYPDDIIITCGCAAVYPQNFLEALYANYKSKPGAAHCYYASRVINDAEGLRFLFGAGDTAKTDFLNMPHANLGLLLPPASMPAAAFDQDVYLRHAPRYCDLWYWLMLLSASVPVHICPELPQYLAKNSCKARNLLEADRSRFELEALSLAYVFKDEIERKTGIKFHRDVLKPHVVKSYAKWAKKEFDLNNCQDYNEKIQFLKIYDDSPLKRALADKYTARKYIRNKVGAEYLVDLYGVWNSVDEIGFERLPNKFVLKTINGCGSILLVPNKANLNLDLVRKKFAEWQQKNIALIAWEMNYFHIPPLIMAEEYLGQNVNDYKFLCFNGEVKYFWVDFDRYIKHKRNIYSPAGELQKFKIDCENIDYAFTLPACLPKMKQLAKILARDFLHARVDMYVTGDSIKIGEITFYPDSGYADFSPRSAGGILGSCLDLSALAVGN